MSQTVQPIDHNEALIAEFEAVYGPHASSEPLFAFDPTAAHLDAESPVQQEARAAAPGQVVPSAGGPVAGPSTGTAVEFNDAVYVSEHAPQWTASIQRYLLALEQGIPEDHADAVKDVHSVMQVIERWKAWCRCATLKDAVRTLATVQHPTLPLAGIRSRAQRVVDFWTNTQPT